MLHRLRLSSIEPYELKDDIIELVKKSDIICPHFHIPLQSGDNEILKKMNRPYSSSFFKDLINKINNAIPHASIGADILIGFPGETDKAFENTYKLIQEHPISYLHVFPFSPREKTPASKYKNQIKSQTIKSRCNQIRKLGNQKKLNFYQKFINQNLKVLIEENSKKYQGFKKGLSSNYIPVLIKTDKNIKNTIIDVKISNIIDNNSQIYAIGHID